MSEPGANGQTIQLVSNARLQALFRYWREKCLGRAMPSFGDLDPVEIPRLLPIVLIADISPAPARVRLLGSEATNACGREMRGRSIEAFNFGAFTATWIEAFSLAMGAVRPTAASGVFCDGARHCSVETVLLPLSKPGGNIDAILGGLHVKPVLPNLQRAQSCVIRVLSDDSQAPATGMTFGVTACASGRPAYRSCRDIACPDENERASI
jgi:hypothetical protein